MVYFSGTKKLIKMHAYSASRSATSGLIQTYRNPWTPFSWSHYRLNISVIQSQFSVKYLLPWVCMIFTDHFLGLTKAITYSLAVNSCINKLNIISHLNSDIPNCQKRNCFSILDLSLRYLVHQNG